MGECILLVVRAHAICIESVFNIDCALHLGFGEVVVNDEVWG